MNKFERISCHCFIKINGYAYFSNWFYNGLFRTNLKTGETLFLGSFGNEIVSEFNIHWEALQHKESIYFFPRRGRHVHIYSLTSQSISSIEIREASEDFFRIKEIIIRDANIIFLPMEEKAPIRTLDLNTQIVSDVATAQQTFDGIYLSKSAPTFPKPQLLEKYRIERADRFSWMQMQDGKWCAFLPMGCHLLWYTPTTQTIDAVPLTVTNEKELDTYLQPMRQAYLCKGLLNENKPLTFHEYLKTISRYEVATINTNKKKDSIGQNIWCFMKIRNFSGGIT